MEVKLDRFNYPEELASQRKLFAECFPETVGSPLVTEEHYNWKFKSFPADGKETAYEYVAKLEDELIGYYAAIPYPYIVNNKNENEVIEEIVEKKPDIVFAALGSPKQEFLMTKLLQEHKALYMGLGGSFDLYTGRAKPVPKWWNKVFKWEGLYRLIDDIANVKRLKRQKVVLKYFNYMIKGKI